MKGIDLSFHVTDEGLELNPFSVEHDDERPEPADD